MGYLSSPVYMGTDERRQQVGAIVNYQWANGIYAGGNGFGWRISQQPDLQYGVGLAFNPGRKQGDSVYLRGMGDIKDQVALGAFVNASITKGLSLSSTVQLGSGNTRDGAVFNVGAAYTLPISAALDLNVSAGASFANAHYMATYFGVDVSQASTSGYATYTPGGGLRNTAVGLGLNYKLAPHWLLSANLSSTVLSNAANDSPLVRKRNSHFALFGVVYTF